MSLTFAERPVEVQPISNNSVLAARSPFERTLLPKFAHWFLDRVNEYQPDIFVPVETKGARLLEATLLYARNQLGSAPRVPVLYTPALAFVDPDELANARLMLLDDAARTGSTLEAHRQRVARYGANEVDMTACVATDHQRLAEIHTFRRVDEPAYREYLFQLAELVVARGLPPEVDHHVFTLSMRGALADSWADLIEHLRYCGELSVDGALTTSADIQSMTLHFPNLPQLPGYPTKGSVYDEGAKKLRLFADSTSNLIHVVPIAFPALDLPAGNDPYGLSESVCRQVVAGWTQSRETVASVLIDEARTRDADFLFRTISTATEVDLVCGFARLLGSELTDVTVSLASDRDLFARLYGHRVGDIVADRVDQELAVAFSDGVERSPPRSAIRHSPPVLQLDATVVDATREVANYLKAHFVAHTKMPKHDPIKRIGLSLTDLARLVPPDGVEKLLLSRCIDYGLARTTLVPFTDVLILDDGRVKIRRKYRVAEASRSDEEYEGVETMRGQTAEELVALTARTLSQRTSLWPDGWVPYEVVARTLAVLQAVLEESNASPLQIVFSLAGPEVILGEDPDQKSVYSVSSRHFRLEGNDIASTEHFNANYEAKALRLDDRGAMTEQIENYLRGIASFVEDADDVAGQLLTWATIAQPGMGLDVIDRYVRQATEALSRTVNILVRGDRPEVAFAAAAQDRAADYLYAAKSTIARLDGRLADAAKTVWQTPDRCERNLRQRTVAPHRPDDLLGLAKQTCDIVTLAAEQLAVLVAAVGSDDTDEEGVATGVVDEMVRLERAVTTLTPEGIAPNTPGDETVALAATHIQRMLNLARLRVAAQACLYPGRARPWIETDAGRRRLATVMVADLSGSTPRSVRHAHSDTVAWGNGGLNLVAQWSRAFGGTEINRKGDDIRIEFQDPNCAVLCASVIQQHTCALRATGREDVAWGCRIALDTGEVTDGDGPNPLGRCLNVASKLVGFRKADEDAIERVLLTPATSEACSARLREELMTPLGGEEFVLAPDFSVAIDDEGVRMMPMRVDPGRAVQALLGSAPEGAAVSIV